MAALIRAYLAVSPGEASNGGSSLAMLRSGMQSKAISTGREFELLISAEVSLLIISIRLASKSGV